MTRRARILSRTGVYHVMLRGNERKDIFLDNEDKTRFLDGIEAKNKDIAFVIYAYCIMDNHVHLLISVQEQELAAIIQGIAVRYATFYNWKHNRIGHVFQDRFKSEPIEDDQYLLTVVRYIHNNPVKAHLVNNSADYRWSSYSHYLKSNSRAWLDTEFVLNILAADRQTALGEFVRFSLEIDNTNIIDIEDNNDIRTIEEGREYLLDFLLEQYIGLSIEQIKEDPQKRTEIIRLLRTNTKLPQRIIASLLGIKKNIVERVKIN